MTEKIEPALTAEGWRLSSAAERPEHALGSLRGLFPSDEYFDAADLPAVIALANAALPDSDPRKITRERVAAIRTAAEGSRRHYNAEPFANALRDFANALESYLPPDKA